ncbi:MAG TPA: penicillin-binding transpeptidase domain-containing protein [Sediminibacterium sp.]|nr:penicillin-binding transpeptidase domain-containing protein [Sediminibacterium sp.]
MNQNKSAGKWILWILGVSLVACSPNNVHINNDIGRFFKEQKVSGCFGLFDNGSGQFEIYNLSRFKDSAYLPASTFKIVNSLIGVETGRISNEKMIIKWDGKVRFFPGGDTAKAWNRDLSMEEAFKVSAVPYYQEVARRIGKDTMLHWLDSLHYGKRTGPFLIDTFWLNNSLKITPDEQLGLVKKLYFGQLPFQKRTQDIVKKVMLQESNANYRLSYKTGWAHRENGNSIGWVVGWIEENRHPYFFVLNMEAPPSIDLAAVRLTLLKNILRAEGFFEGKK